VTQFEAGRRPSWRRNSLERRPRYPQSVSSDGRLRDHARDLAGAELVKAIVDAL
jgi:hypothetical protein